MRRKKAFKRGRAISILVAGSVGYLIGNWNATALRTTDASAAQTVGQRFPREWNDAMAVQAAVGERVAPTLAMAIDDLQPMLFNPAPMVPRTAAPRAAVQSTAAEAASPSPAPAAAPPPPAKAEPATDKSGGQPVAEAKRTAALAYRRANRQGFLLDDAQIANIKERLHLTPEQERMWPAVATALRNIAFANAREAHRRGAAGAKVQVAAVDPDSVEVQDLKSAAIPLIMSFSDEQKDEVRSLAHVMGLDRLASQF